MKKVHIKIGDNVTIISGSEKNKIGEVIKINQKTGKIIVKGVNFKFKQIKQLEAAIHHSNVKLNSNNS